ncbi:ketosteroid isomerase-like protein [Silvimonas terrae]|uniref:Ketosteroid isomerase-like protein n=1 Tax=Silvimonas terrae TaxID=300266 RepID=A0A840RE69_9NEIS|nr:nuclear transport factor 2 family protein [Silvimonas terrae]MBB5190551.1 ketosteroid isomerase-like protein [Silvimonas terrae]
MRNDNHQVTGGAEAVVREFWRLMQTNDFDAVGTVLSDDFVVEWPQTNELIRGQAHFAGLNREYPAHGPWQFTLNQLVASPEQVVTDVSVTDGVQVARAISFFTVTAAKISKLREYWPEPYDAPANRAQWVEALS